MWTATIASHDKLALFARRLLCLLSVLSLVACGNMTQQRLIAEEYFSSPLALEMAESIEKPDLEHIKKLAKEIDIDLQGEQGITFLMWALRHEQLPAYKLLLVLGSDPNAEMDGSYPLGLLSQEDIRWLTPLVEAGADVNLKRADGTPLWWDYHYAGNWRAYEYLLSLPQLNINAQDSAGYTASMILAGQQDYDRVLELLKKGADIHLKTSNGNTLAYRVQENIPPETSQQNRLHKEVHQMLESEGITFPVLGPRELMGLKK